jgi:hypothetical protein
MHIANKSALLFTLDSTNQAQEIVNPLAEYLGINFFGYMTLYNDCRFTLLINGSNEFLTNYFNLIKEQDPHFIKEFRSTLDNGPNHFLWPTKYKIMRPVVSLHSEHDIWHGYSINYRHSEYIEHYTDNVKQKLGIRYKNELLDILLT